MVPTEASREIPLWSHINERFERREIPGDSWREEVITTAARGSTGSFGATGCLIINTECGANTDAADGPGNAPTPP